MRRVAVFNELVKDPEIRHGRLTSVAIANVYYGLPDVSSLDAPLAHALPFDQRDVEGKERSGEQSNDGCGPERS